MQFILHRVSYSFSLQLQTSSCSSLIVIPPSLHLLPSDVSFGQWFESHAVLQAPHITFSTSWITQTGASYDRRSPVPNWPQPFQPHDQPDLLSREIIPTKKSMVVYTYLRRHGWENAGTWQTHQQVQTRQNAIYPESPQCDENHMRSKSRWLRPKKMASRDPEDVAQIGCWHVHCFPGEKERSISVWGVRWSDTFSTFPEFSVHQLHRNH